MPPYGTKGLIVLTSLLLAALLCPSQQKPSTKVPSTSHGSSAQGSLTVSFTVVSSATVFTDSDGTQKLIVANAPEGSDNGSRPQYVPLVPVTQKAEPKKAEQDNLKKRNRVERQVVAGPGLAD